jgi:hypothetical protein
LKGVGAQVSRRGVRWSGNAAPVATILTCLVVGWWITTGGTGHPFKPYDLILATFYDAQGESIL